MEFEGKVIKTTTEDGLELEAILTQPKEPTKRVIIHFHGKEGDFLQNHFIFQMAKEYPRAGIAFMTASHRGKNYLSDIIRRSATGFEYAQLGSAFDIFEDSIYDIQAWVDEAKKHGFEEIFLQAHSTPQKILWYVYQKKQPKEIKALILISPSDIAYLFEHYVNDYQQNLELARKKVEEGKGRELMPVTLWSNCPVSASTFYNWGKPESNIQVFNYSHPDRGFKYFPKVTLPMIAILGGEDFAVGTPPQKCLQMLKEQTSSSNFKTVFIPHAAHSYLGHERELIDPIVNWVRGIK